MEEKSRIVLNRSGLKSLYICRRRRKRMVWYSLVVVLLCAAQPGNQFMLKFPHRHNHLGKNWVDDSVHIGMPLSGVSAGDLEDRSECLEDREAVEGAPKSR